MGLNDCDHILSAYWINRKGKILRLDEYGEDTISAHYEIARKFFPNERFPEDVAMEKGWCKVGGVRGYPSLNQMPSDQQMQTLTDLGYALARIYVKDGSIYTPIEKMLKL